MFVRSGTLPAGHVIARIALPPGPAGSPNAQVHIPSMLMDEVVQIDHRC